MLNSLRKHATGWVAQLFIGLLVLSFAVWGVADVFTGFRSDAVAQVGSTDISVLDFQRDYDRAVQNLSRQLGSPISQQQAAQMGIPGQILGRLVSQAMLDEAAATLGLGMSNEALGHRIATDPQFFGSTGIFDRGYLTQVIRAQGLTEDQFIVRQRAEYLRGQLGQALAGGTATPESYLRAVHEFRSEERDLSYVILTAPPEGAIAAPSETELAAWFAERKDDWRAPEYRAVTYFTLAPDQIAKAGDVSDEDARARYDANAQRFSTVERRQVQQIVFVDRREADAAAKALAGGQTFDDLLVTRNLKPEDIDLGLVPKAQLADPAIAEAAFALSANAVSPVVDGRFGPVILRVTAIEPGVVTPFGDVVATLKTEIATERAVAEINDMHDAIEDNRAAGDTISETAAKYGIPAVTVAAIDATGNDDAGNPMAGLPAGLLAATFESDVGLENNPIQPDRASFTWFEVTAVTEPRAQTLSEVHDRVVAAWRDEARKTRLQAEAAALQVAVNDRGSLDAVARERLLDVKTSQNVTRVATPAGDLSASALRAAFDAPAGRAAVADGAQPMTALVLRVDNVSVPPYLSGAADLAQAKQQFDGQLVGDLLGMYVGDLQSQTEVRFNQPLLEQVLGVVPN